MSNNFWHPKKEQCGFILMDGTVVLCENQHPKPEHGFKISDTDIKKHDGDIAYFWHSHPSNDLNLSIEDYHGFLQFPDHRHRIYGATHYAEYFIRRGFVMREENDSKIS